MHTFNPKNTKDWSADLVIETAEATYVCNIDPTRANRQPSAPPIEQQNCWLIARYTLTQESDGTEKTRTMYPYGLKRYEFAPAQFENYTYQYGF